MKPATAAVLNLLRTRGADGLTPAEARTALGCDRLAARIHELKAEGYQVETLRERSGGAAFARYVLRERARPTTGVQRELFACPR